MDANTHALVTTPNVSTSQSASSSAQTSTPDVSTSPQTSTPDVSPHDSDTPTEQDND